MNENLCCFSRDGFDCKEAAVFYIHQGPGYEDNTFSCRQHLGDMMEDGMNIVQPVSWHEDPAVPPITNNDWKRPRRADDGEERPEPTSESVRCPDDPPDAISLVTANRDRARDYYQQQLGRVDLADADGQDVPMTGEGR
jgi:hypothetical protein